jgi:hypothetical protein
MSELSFVALTPTSFLARSALVHGDREQFQSALTAPADPER